jgi:hypothetical protein
MELANPVRSDRASRIVVIMQRLHEEDDSVRRLLHPERDPT